MLVILPNLFLTGIYNHTVSWNLLEKVINKLNDFPKTAICSTNILRTKKKLESNRGV